MDESEINFLHEERIRQAEAESHRRQRRWLFIIVGLLLCGGCVSYEFRSVNAPNTLDIDGS